MRRHVLWSLAALAAVPLTLVLGARLAASHFLGGEAPSGGAADRERHLAAVAGRWQEAAASFLLSGRATFSLGEEEASALLSERLAGTRVGAWEIRGVRVEFQPGRARGDLFLAPPRGPVGFLLGGREVPVRLALVPRVAGRAVEVRLAEVRVGRVALSPERVLTLLEGWVSLPAGLEVEAARGLVRLVPADLGGGVQVAVDSLEVGPGELNVDVRSAG